jgi:hypothetical protein
VPAPLDSESSRANTVRRYVRLLERSPVDTFRNLVDVAARVCATPSAAISVVDEAEQWFIVTSGLPVPALPRALSFCGRAILQDDPFVVPNTFADERLRSSPIVAGEPKIRSYAGMPLTTTGPCRIGALCVFDTSPRNLSDKQIGALRTLGRSAVSELEVLRLGYEVELRSRIIENSSDCVKVLDLDAHLLSMNAGGRAAFEITDFESVAGSSWVDLWKGEDGQSGVRTGRGLLLLVIRQILTLLGRLADLDSSIHGVRDPPPYAGRIGMKTQRATCRELALVVGRASVFVVGGCGSSDSGFVSGWTNTASSVTGNIAAVAGTGDVFFAVNTDGTLFRITDAPVASGAVTTSKSYGVLVARTTAKALLIID